MITFTTEQVVFRLEQKNAVKTWVRSILAAENEKEGEIAYVFCNDAFLSGLNEKYLRHKTLTDIITFDYSDAGKLSGDICISVERVSENAQKFDVPFENELARVMAHGILHLAGYTDKDEETKKEMRAKEDLYLASFPLT
jgi:rRNA maturation RNase YbeY